MLCPEVLELGAVGACLLGECNQVLGSLEVAVMVRRDVSDEVSGLNRADEAVTEAECRHRFIVGGRSVFSCLRWGHALGDPAGADELFPPAREGTGAH